MPLKRVELHFKVGAVIHVYFDDTSDTCSSAAHDFFAPQPVKDADVFVLRAIMHDWSDKYCIQILRHLREAAAESARFIVIDRLMAYACADDTLNSVPGARFTAPPAPLLANGGYSSAMSYFADIQMLELQNGKERTVVQFQRLLEAGGWRLVHVVRSGDFFVGSGGLIAAPA